MSVQYIGLTRFNANQYPKFWHAPFHYQFCFVFAALAFYISDKSVEMEVTILPNMDSLQILVVSSVELTPYQGRQVLYGRGSGSYIWNLFCYTKFQRAYGKNWNSWKVSPSSNSKFRRPRQRGFDVTLTDQSILHITLQLLATLGNLKSCWPCTI